MTSYLAQQLTLPDVSGSGTSIQGPITKGILLDSSGKITFASITSALLPFIFIVAGIGLLFMIISAGFGLLTSAGDTKKMEKGKNQLTSALIGFVIIFAAYWLVQIAGTMLGLTTITDVFK